MDSLNRHIQLLEALRIPHAVVDNTLYYQSAGVTRTWGPASVRYELSRQQGLSLCRQLHGHLVILTGGFQENICQNWYAVICERFHPLEEMKAKNRSEINRGLRNCQVQRIDPKYVADHGFEVMNAAIKGYSNYTDKPETPEEFRMRHLSCAAFDDVVHYWGAFHEGRLIGYAKNILFDRTEANYWIIRLHPEFLSLYAGYALVYKMNEYYLRTEGFQYVNDGWRSILHETQIQSFLIRKFGFRKAHTPMSVVYGPVASLIIRTCYPWRRLAGRIDSRLAGLCNLEAIRRCEDEDDTPVPKDPAPAKSAESEPVADPVDC